MIGMDRNTGRTITGWEQLVSRIQQVITTRIGAREKRRDFGSRVPETLAKNMSDNQLMLAQAFVIDAFYNPVNGISDFKPTRCIATRRDTGISFTIEGAWHSKTIKTEVLIVYTE